jgi:predicted sulfurtransferase
MPFQRLKVRLKKEIVTLGDTAVDPTRRSAPMSNRQTGTS